MNILSKALLTNMKKARKRLGYSQEKLAELCDLSLSFVADLEVGRRFPSAETLIRIASSLDLKPYQLLMDESEDDVVRKYENVISMLEDLKTTLSDDVAAAVKRYLQ